MEPPLPLDEVIEASRDPIALARLLAGRTNAERQAAIPAYFERRGWAFARHGFVAAEGSGENFALDVGAASRILVLAAHHDAVPGSPGANDNAIAVGILLTLAEALADRPPAMLRVRFLFPAAEELGYLGARHYVQDWRLDGIAGVLSLELCGIGDSVVVWDAAEETPFLRAVTTALERLGRRRDESYHVVGHIPVFGSDHRAFAAAGIPAYGLSIVPAREAEALRQFVLNPAQNPFATDGRIPAPFDTYHTPGDALHTLDPGAAAAVLDALEAVVRELDTGRS